MTRLRYERVERRLTQDTLCVLLNFHQPSLAMIERGRLIPSKSELEKLAAFFGCSPDVLLKPIKLAE